MSETLAPDLAVAIKKWSRKRGNLIMILHELQDHHGYVPRELAKEVARELDVPLARIYEVLTFYNYFKLEAPGKYVHSVCLGTACYLKGAPQVLSSYSQALGVQEDQTTPDGEHHLQSVRCLGCCGLAPVVMVNSKIFAKVKPQRVGDIIDECNHGGVEAHHG
jgi:NADH-quinone oxidoreductase subunit E